MEWPRAWRSAGKHSFQQKEKMLKVRKRPKMRCQKFDYSPMRSARSEIRSSFRRAWCQISGNPNFFCINISLRLSMLRKKTCTQKKYLVSLTLACLWERHNRRVAKKKTTLGPYLKNKQTICFCSRIERFAFLQIFFEECAQILEKHTQADIFLRVVFEFSKISSAFEEISISPQVRKRPLFLTSAEGASGDKEVDFSRVRDLIFPAKVAFYFPSWSVRGKPLFNGRLREKLIMELQK